MSKTYLPIHSDNPVRPKIKDFFGEDATLDQVHNTYLSQPELFKYAQALDNYIDELESIAVPISVKSGEESWIPISNRPDKGDFVIKAKHENGLTDVMRLIDGGLYNYDSKTDSAVTHFIVTSTLRAESIPTQSGESMQGVTKK